MLVECLHQGGVMKTLIIFFALFTGTLQAEEIFLLPTKIGDRIFNDLLTIEYVGSTNQLKGSLTVPGVFSVPIVNGKMKIDRHGTLYLFSIKALENGTETLVHYDMFLDGNSIQKISGTLRLENGEVLGEIRDGVRLKGDKQ